MDLAARAVEWRDYLRSVRRSENTIRCYLADVHLFLAGLPPGVPHAPGREAVARFVEARLAGGDSPQTVKRRVLAVSSFARYLVDRGILDTNPASGMARGLPSPRLVHECLSQEQVCALIHAADDHGRSWAPIAVSLLYYCGLRVSEAVALRRGALQVEDSAVKVRGKGGHERLVPVSDSLRARLAQYPPRARFVPVCVEQVRKELKRLSVLAGIAPVAKPHLLRASSATHILRAGAPSRAVQMFLGHSSLRTTERYMRLSHSDVVAAAALLQ